MMSQPLCFKVMVAESMTTGCPTLWEITPELCKEIPTGNQVIFTLTGVQRDRKRPTDAEYSKEKL